MKDKHSTTLFYASVALIISQSACFSATGIDNPDILKRNYAAIYEASLSSEEASRSSTSSETEINSPVLGQINNVLRRHHGWFELSPETYPEISQLSLKYGVYPHDVSFDAINTKVSLTWDRGKVWGVFARKPKTKVFQLIVSPGVPEVSQSTQGVDAVVPLPVATLAASKNTRSKGALSHDTGDNITSSSSTTMTVSHKPFQERAAVQKRFLQNAYPLLGSKMTLNSSNNLVSSELRKLLNELYAVNGIACRMYLAPAQQDQLIRDLMSFGLAYFTIETDAKGWHYFIAQWHAGRKMYILHYLY